MTTDTKQVVVTSIGQGEGMPRWTQIYLCVLLTVLGLRSAESAFADSRIILDGGHQTLVLGRKMEYLVDAEGRLGIEALRDSGTKRTWEYRDSEAPNFGFLPKGAVWARFEVLSPQPQQMQLILESSNALTDSITVYLFHDGKLSMMQAGDHIPRELWIKDQRWPVFPLSINQTAEVYIRIASSSSIQFPFTLYSSNFYADERVTRETIQALYYGAILSIMLYNLCVGIGTGIATYLYYVGFLASFTFFQLCYTGYGGMFLGHLLPAYVIDYSIFLGVALTGLFSHIFSAQLLGASLRAQSYKRICWFFSLAAILTVPIYAFFPYRYSVLFVSVGITLPWFLILIRYTVEAFRRKEAVAPIYTLAWSIFFLGTLCVPLKAFNAIPVNVFTDHLQQFGSAVEFILLSFALAYRIKILENRVKTELVEKEKARTIFFHNISHELRTPLNGIMGFLDLVHQGNYGAVSDDARTQIGKALRLADSLKLQVNTILDLAKSRRGELSLICQFIDLRGFKSDADDLAEGLCLKSKGLSYKSSLRVMEKPFCGDKEKIFTIVRNLLGNAFKFKDPERDNQVELSIEQFDEYLQIVVSDTGVGIPDAAKSGIFEEFVQVQGDARRAYEGTGLGLTLVRDLVQGMKGSIELESTERGGSRFKVTIPIAQQALVQEVEARDLVPLPSSGGSTWARSDQVSIPQVQSDSQVGAGYDVFVIDDNQVNCELIAGILHIEGYTVRCAQSGKAGLGEMRTARPHVLLLDMMMPEMSGADVIEIMKHDPLLQEVPVILITARASEEDRLEGLRLGADDYLAKPIFSAELRLRVRNIIERHRLLRTAERSAHEEKLMQLGELFADLSHELKNIQYSVSSARDLSERDALLATAVISLEDDSRAKLAKAMVSPSQHKGLFERINDLEQRAREQNFNRGGNLPFLLAQLDLAQDELYRIWNELMNCEEIELNYTESQLKIFMHYFELLRANGLSRDISQTVLDYTRVESNDQACSLEGVWQQTQLLLKARLKVRTIRWDVRLDPLQLAISKSSLIQVLLNLCLNAAEAIEQLEAKDQWITLESKLIGDAVHLYVSNGGKPIPKEIHSSLFQRGFSTKGSKGNGIGLYVCARLIQQARGELRYVAESPNPCFVVRIQKYSVLAA